MHAGANLSRIHGERRVLADRAARDTHPRVGGGHAALVALAGGRTGQRDARRELRGRLRRDATQRKRGEEK
jgi:hypothetical protein